MPERFHAVRCLVFQTHRTGLGTGLAVRPILEGNASLVHDCSSHALMPGVGLSMDYRVDLSYEESTRCWARSRLPKAL